MTTNVYPIGEQLAELLKDTSAGKEIPRSNAEMHWLAMSGSPIADVKIDSDRGENGSIVIRFETGDELQLMNSSNSCCESRYLASDDDLASFKGARLTSLELEGGQDQNGEWGDVTETMFAKFRTSNGDFTVTAYNSHNGYYGGVSLDPSWIPAGGDA